MLITPLVGSAIGEGFYKLKRRIVCNGYQLAGSSFLGNLVVFIIDPVNEVIDLFRGSKTRGLYNRTNKVEIGTAFVPVYGSGMSMNVSVRF